MKLYKIMVTHYAPKDFHSSIQEYVVATCDRDVFEYLASGYAYWEDILEYCDDEEYAREEYEEILRNKGDDREVSDLYYGATQYGWEEVEIEQNTQVKDMISLMVETGLAKKIPVYKEDI